MSSGGFFDNVGALYGLYNENIVSYYEASQMLDDAAEFFRSEFSNTTIEG
jgi:hypothetical protein